MESREGSVQPVLNLIGERVALGPIRRDLLPLYQRWINDLEVTRTLGAGHVPMTFEAEQAWFERAAKGDEVAFTVYERATLRPIGNTGWHKPDPVHRTAELGIMIGEKDCWNKGFGTETVRLMLEYGFTVLGLHSAYLRHVAYNERGHRAYLKAGFREMGRRRESVYWAGKYHDMVHMDCLASEFQGEALRHLREI